LQDNKLSLKLLASQSKAYYAKKYLGLTIPEHQYEWLEELLFQPQHQQVGLLSPRDHGKTTIVPRVSAEHITLFNKNDNILLLSKTYNQAKKTLETIYNDLTKNQRIKLDFKKELSDLRKVGNQLFFNMPDVEDENKRDAKIESNGILGDITGGHFTYILMDDIFDDENTRTQSNIDTIMRFIKGTVIPLLEPDGKLLFIATHKHYNDGYNRLKKNKSWKIITQKAILKYPKSWEYIDDEDGTIVGIKNIVGDSQVLWSEKWPIEKLLLKKAVMGDLIFRREYQNETEQLKGSVLKDVWLKYYAINPENIDTGIEAMPPLESMSVYQSIDLAIKKGENNDYFVIATIGVTQNPFRRYILDWYRAKLDFPEQVEAIKKNYISSQHSIWRGRKWPRPLMISIESNAYQVALAQYMVSFGGYPINPVYSTSNKEVRITAGSVHYQNGTILIPVDHPETENFKAEYREFPGGAHEDMLDSTDIGINSVIDNPKPAKSTVTRIKLNNKLNTLNNLTKNRRIKI
jgi:predicted phage terminase large subunit-like protein